MRITFNHELLGGHTEAELVASLQRRNTGSFEFGPVMAAPGWALDQGASRE